MAKETIVDIEFKYVKDAAEEPEGHPMAMTMTTIMLVARSSTAMGETFMRSYRVTFGVCRSVTRDDNLSNYLYIYLMLE